MTVPKLVLCSLLCLIAGHMSTVVRGDDKETNRVKRRLSRNEYRITIAASEQRTVSHRIRIEVDNQTGHVEGSLLRKLKGKTYPVELLGVREGDALKLVMSGVESDKILTYHFVGRVVADDSVKGNFVCFIDAKKKFDGEWTLGLPEKKADAKKAGRGNKD